MASNRDAPFDRALKSRKEFNTRDHCNPLFHPAEHENTLAPAGNIASVLTPPEIALLPVQHTVPLEHAPLKAAIIPFSFDRPELCPYSVEKLVYRKVESNLSKPAFLSTSATGRRQA
jgi:hypothetical protein